VMDGVRYVLRTGCGWDYVPHDLPHRSTVRYYFDVWTRDGTLAAVNATLREQVRRQAAREEQPSAGLLDSWTARPSKRRKWAGYAASTGGESLDANATS